MKKDSVILLYGSHARGDADSISDVDVLVIGPTKPIESKIADLLPKSCVGILHISHYTWEEFEVMSNYGSLFLHHIATESKALRYEGDAYGRLKDLLKDLPPYRLAKRDIDAFRVTLDDVNSGLKAGLPPCFELAVLGGVSRHASVLGCYILGKPTYGRKSIARAADLLLLGSAQEDLELAHRFRLYEEGQCATPSDVSMLTVKRIGEVLSIFLDRLEEVIYANAA